MSFFAGVITGFVLGAVFGWALIGRAVEIILTVLA